jgi:hypothetical protein
MPIAKKSVLPRYRTSHRRSILLSRALLLASLIALFWLSAPLARADEVGNCRSLGSALVEHSCFHSTFGPFSTVEGAIVDGTPAPDVSGVHTEYRVGLGAQGAARRVEYVPKRSGVWVIFTDSPIALRVVDALGKELAPIYRQDGSTGCDALPVARAFPLEAGATYHLHLGPSDTRTTILVIEYFDDFILECGRDQDGDGYGSMIDIVRTVCQPPEGYAANALDCDDTNSAIHPEALELCDGVDSNCNGSPDDVGLTCRVGVGACQRRGVFTCAEQELPAICSATPAAPASETCNLADDDCDGEIDEEHGLCSHPNAPVCVRAGSSAFCGCLLDSDCAGPDSGRICNVIGRQCEDGCRSSPGGNQCPSGFTCQIDATAGSGTCQPLPVDTGVGSKPPPVDKQFDTNGGPDGCACVVAARVTTTGSWGLLITLVALSFRKRSWRRQLWQASVVLLGCGGRIEPNDQAYDSEENDDGKLSAPCSPQLGKPPVAHACSHMTFGSVTAIVGVAAAVPDLPSVSLIHTVYELRALHGEDAFSVGFRPVRGGAHAILTDASSDTVVRALLGGTSLEPKFRGATMGCAAITLGHVFSFTQDADIVLRFENTAAKPIRVFIEHLGTFGEEAWVTSC